MKYQNEKKRIGSTKNEHKYQKQKTNMKFQKTKNECEEPQGKTNIKNQNENRT